MNDTEMMELISQAIESWRNEELNAFSTLLVIARLINPPLITTDDIEWADATVARLQLMKGEP